MKKLSTSLKQNYGKLNESAVESKETFFRFGKTALAMNQGDEYSEIEANVLLQSIYDTMYPSYTDMLQELTRLVMSKSQKSDKAKALVTEIFADIINDPNVSNYYPKLAKALSFDNLATVENYIDALARITEQINTSEIDIEKYFNVRNYGNTTDIDGLIQNISTPAHALLIVESGLMLYTYILANVNNVLETENLKKFYNDVVLVYNDYKEYSTIYEMDINSARNYFISALSHKDPTYYLTGDKIETVVTDVALPTFIASFMNVFGRSYELKKDRLNKYVDPDVLNKFNFYFEMFMDTNKLHKGQLFLLPNNDSFGSKKLKQLYYAGLQITAKIKNMTMRRNLMHFLNYSKPIIDDMLTIEEREYAMSGGGY